MRFQTKDIKQTKKKKIIEIIKNNLVYLKIFSWYMPCFLTVPCHRYGDERHICHTRMRVPEAEASGDNDEAEIGLRDKSLKTTVEQLQLRLSQAEREIVALKRYRTPQKCQSHERCEEILRRDLLTWRDDHEKRINSEIVSWQLTEQRRIHEEIGNMRKVYDTIQQHLETLERQNAKSYFDFRRQIDVWEKRFKEDVVSLHDSDLIELREQLKAW